MPAVVLWIHPVLALATVVSTIGVALLGWRSRLTRASGSAHLHVAWGKRLLGLLALVWVVGLSSVVLANRSNARPAMSGHFVIACVLLGGYSVSAVLMLRWRQRLAIRRLHMLANTLLVGLVLYQVLLGVNRLYKFDLIAPVPQDQSIRSWLQIKFGLESPPVTAQSGHTYAWSSPNEGTAYGGVWKPDNGAIVQSDCACSGNGILDFLTLDGRFPLLVFNEPVFGDFMLSGEFLIESGQVDRYAGLVFRIVNENNYYVARASTSEQSVTLSRFNNGSRQVLQSFPTEVPLNTWQTLQVEVVGQIVRLTLNGTLVGEVTDDGWLTGRVGLGTKADSVARFRSITATNR
jgi:hypothetical protein